MKLKALLSVAFLLVTTIASAFTIDYYNKDLPFSDQLIVTCEPFFLWVIEGSLKLLEIFPVDQLKDIDVMVVPDLGIYRTRKVRILNGSHKNLNFQRPLVAIPSLLESMHAFAVSQEMPQEK